MKLKLTLIGLLLVVIVTVGYLYSQYLTPSYTYKKPNQAAFVISFDDQYVEEWYNHRVLFKKYNVKATFFITNAESLTVTEVNMLHALVADGHEVGSHSAEHVNAIEFIENRSLQSYILNETLPSIRILQKHGFVPVTFAYPYGANSRQSDFELYKYFFLLRGDSWKVEGKSIAELDRIYYKFDGSRIVNGLGVDENSGVTMQDLESGFKRAYREKEAIIIYAHNITDKAEGYAVTPQKLESIFKLAQKYNLISLQFKELII